MQYKLLLISCNNSIHFNKHKHTHMSACMYIYVYIMFFDYHIKFKWPLKSL